MSKYVEFTFCELPETPREFDVEKFKDKDPKQMILYKNSKAPRRKKILTYEQITDDDKLPNYARVVPKGCLFIDFDDPDEAEKMKEIILHSGLRCLILETSKGYHFLFRTPDFYKKEMTGATNWFGYKFDTKATTDKSEAVQIIRVCGMEREERTSWDLSPIVAESINIETLDILPYWLWGKLKDSELHKKGKPGESEYHLDDTPFTQLMKMREGGRHDHIVSLCSYFAISNGFMIEEFKTIINMIHDLYLAKLGTPMSDSDLFGDLPERWADYEAMLLSSGYEFIEKDRFWKKVKSKTDDKIDERRAAEYLYKQYDFYGRNPRQDGTFDGLLYREIDGTYNYMCNLPKIRQTLKDHSDQNFKETYFKEVEVQLMQMCATNNKIIKRSQQYVIVKNKVLSCILPDSYEFSWLGTRPPTDVVLPWNWYSREWVKEHEEDLGGIIKKFIKELARNSTGVSDPIVEQWLYIVAGAAMIPGNRLEKIVVLAGGGRNGKSLYTSLIRLCLGEDMFNTSKIFDSSPQDSFWGAGLDHGILCVVDDLPQHYNRDAFSYIKGAITKTDTVVINEKFKPKKELRTLPTIIACTNFEFELYDKSEGMRRRVLILPTEYEVPIESRDLDLQFKLVLNTTDIKEIAEYRMQDNTVGNDEGVLVKDMMTKEKGVLDSLDNGSLAWFANKCRYDYFDWVLGDIKLESSDGMKEKLAGTFSGGFDAEMQEFIEWYLTERSVGTWTRDLYNTYVDWHNEMATGEGLMKEKVFSMKLGKAIKLCVDKGFKVAMRKRKNDKGMSLNYLFVGEEAEEK